MSAIGVRVDIVTHNRYWRSYGLFSRIDYLRHEDDADFAAYHRAGLQCLPVSGRGPTAELGSSRSMSQMRMRSLPGSFRARTSLRTGPDSVVGRLAEGPVTVRRED